MLGCSVSGEDKGCLPGRPAYHAGGREGSDGRLGRGAGAQGGAEQGAWDWVT